MTGKEIIAMRKDISTAEERHFKAVEVYFKTVAQKKVLLGLIRDCIATGVNIAKSHYDDGYGYQGNGW